MNINELEYFHVYISDGIKIALQVNGVIRALQTSS